LGIEIFIIFSRIIEVAQSFIGTVRDIVVNKGPLALYQGVVPYLIADGLSGAVKFATFELSRRYTEKKLPAKYHPIARFLCAALAMLICSVVLVPGEVLKTRLQAGAVSFTHLWHISI
jgi:hypothetical protein